QQRPDRQRRDHLEAGPTGLVSAHQPPDESEGAAAHQREAGDVEAGVWAEALLHPGEYERDREQPDRHVDPEDPLPADSLDDGTADERPARHGDPRDRTEDPDRR